MAMRGTLVDLIGERGYAKLARHAEKILEAEEGNGRG